MNSSHSPQLPKVRSFGLLFTAVFWILSAFAYVKGSSQVGYAALLIAGAAVMVITFIAPKLLAPFNRAWFALGLLLGKVVSPVVLGVMFFFVITPVALVCRLFGRDELRLKRADQDSYWIDRTPAGPASDSFKNQF